MRGRWTAAALGLGLAACGSGSADGAARKPPAAETRPSGADDWYPADITPPAGTRYPCALTALPRDLPGIPPADRLYVNHAYALILRATQAKLRLLRALENKEDVAAAQARYDEKVAGLADTLRQETVPQGLAAFQDDLLGALDLQRAFFREAARRRQEGASMPDVYGIAQGRQASSRLIAAWGAMQSRYPSWSAEMKDSVYHHLCALDLF